MSFLAVFLVNNSLSGRWLFLASLLTIVSLDVRSCISYRIRKNIGEELNLANWRIKIKSPIFHLANLFCTCLTQNLARDPSVVAVI